MTVQYQCNGETIKESTTETYKKGESYTVTAPEIGGYHVVGAKTLTGTMPASDTTITFTYERDIKTVDVTITVKNADNVVYDGLQHAIPGAQYTVAVSGTGVTAEDQKAVSVVFTGANQTFGPNAYTYSSNYTKGDFDVTTVGEGYALGNVIIEQGNLTINPAPLTVTYQWAGGANHKTYDGTPLTVTGKVEGFKGDDGGSVKFDGADNASLTNAGSLTVAPSVAFNEGTRASNYTYTWDALTLEIKHAEVTVTADSKSKKYGEADPDLKATVTGLVNGEDESVINYKLSRVKGEDVGPYAITAEYDPDQGNYNVTFTSANLIITPAAVTITAEPKTKVYGEADPDLKATVTGLVNGDDESVINYTLDRADGEDVGPYAITAEYDPDQGNYNVTFISADLTITKRPITIKAKDVTKVYDGTYSKPEGYGEAEVTAGGYADRDTDGFKFKISKDIGNKRVLQPPQTEAKYAIEAVDNGNTKTSNYDITYEDGTWTFQRLPMTVTVENKEKYYGEDDPDYTFTYDGLLDSDKVYLPTRFMYAYTRDDGKDVGEYAIKAQNVAPQGDLWGYDITVNSGKLTIKPRPITITSGSAERVYNGAELTEHSLTTAGRDALAGKAGLMYGDTVTVTYTGSQTVPGTSKNAFTYAFDDSAKAGNYDVTTVEGDLHVLDRPEADRYTITVTANSDTFPFDGSYHTVSGYRADQTEFDGVQYTLSGLSAERSEYEVGTYRVSVVGTPTVTDAAGHDLTDQFNIVRVNGTLAIEVAPPLVPEEPTPLAPAAPTGPAAPAGPDAGDAGDAGDADDAGVVIDDDDTPLAGGPVQGNDGNGGDGVTIEEDETPLAMMNITEDCCVLHLLIMLLALAVTVYYTHNRKKHQARQFELQNRLAQ